MSKKYPLLTFRVRSTEEAKKLSILLDRAVADLNSKSDRKNRITKAEIIYIALSKTIPALKIKDFK